MTSGETSGEYAAVALARRCVDALYAADRATKHLGITIDGVGPGRATARMTVIDTMINGHDLCHGGYLVLLADSAFAFACNTYNRKTVAQGLDVTFLRSARSGDTLVAVAVERAVEGRTGLYDVTVSRLSTSDTDTSRADTEVVAEFRGRSRVVPGTILEVTILDQER